MGARLAVGGSPWRDLPPIAWTTAKTFAQSHSHTDTQTHSHTAAALDLARLVVARRHGHRGFAGGNARRHEALRALSRRNLCRSISDLGRELRCSRQAAHRLATSLARQGLVSIEPGPADRRPLYLELTAAGTRALASAEHDAGPCLDAMGQRLRVREMRAFGVVLRGIRERAAALRR